MARPATSPALGRAVCSLARAVWLVSALPLQAPGLPHPLGQIYGSDARHNQCVTVGSNTRHKQCVTVRLVSISQLRDPPQSTPHLQFRLRVRSHSLGEQLLAAAGDSASLGESFLLGAVDPTPSDREPSLLAAWPAAALCVHNAFQISTGAMK